jgi:hypothetical protein
VESLWKLYDKFESNGSTVSAMLELFFVAISDACSHPPVNGGANRRIVWGMFGMWWHIMGLISLLHMCIVQF